MSALHIDEEDIIERVDDDTFFRFDPDKHEVTKDGQRVTTETVDALADRAEKSGPPPWLQPGGKSLSGGTVHSPRFQVVLSEKTAEEVREAADQSGMSVSKWIRRTIEEKLVA